MYEASRPRAKVRMPTIEAVVESGESPQERIVGCGVGGEAIEEMNGRGLQVKSSNSRRTILIELRLGLHGYQTYPVPSASCMHQIRYRVFHWLRVVQIWFRGD